MKFGRIVLQVNTHRLTESDFRYDITKMAATASFHAEKCCHLMNAHAASARYLSSRVPVPDLQYIHACYYSNYYSVPQRVQYKLAVTVHRSLRHRAPAYLADYCVPVSTVPGRHHLQSARRHQLSVPRVQRSTFGTRAFSVAGPTVWNSLPDDLRDPTVNSVQFRRNLKTHLFA